MQRLLKLNILLFFATFIIFSSCEEKYKEITPLSNENNIKIKLEISEVKTSPGKKAEFTLRLINTGERDLGRCTLKFDNRYEHQLEGLINKSDDWEGKESTSMLKAGDSATLVFSTDCDNYSIFGINDNNFTLPEMIELNCLDGKVTWKTK